MADQIYPASSLTDNHATYAAWGAGTWSFASSPSSFDDVPFYQVVALLPNGFWGYTYVDPDPPLICDLLAGGSIDVFWSSYVVIDVANSNADIGAYAWDPDAFYYTLGAHEMGHAAGLYHDYGGIMDLGYSGGWGGGDDLSSLYDAAFSCP